MHIFLYAFVSAAECWYNSSSYFQCTDEKKIYLNEDMNGELNLNEIMLDIGNIDMPPPTECVKDYCYEETNVVVTIKKTWKPLLSVINNSAMKPSDFAKKFEDIAETTVVDNWSPVFDRVVVQKVLYERWLLGAKPTGKIWYLTELAVMKLQCIKWFSEYNDAKAVFEIGPKTIEAINTLKHKMKDEKYLKNTWFPPVDFAKCGKEFVTRQSKIEWLLQSPPTWANNSYGPNLLTWSSLQRDGEVILKRAD